MEGHDVTDKLDLGRGGVSPVAYAPPRRRMTTSAHAEFVGALVREFRSSLASLEAAGERLAACRRDLDEAVLTDLSAVIDRQTRRVGWLVRLLEAVDGDGTSRHAEEVHGPTVARQAAAGGVVPVEIPDRVERDEEVFFGDPERVRLGLEILFEALTPTSGTASARMPVPGFLTVVAPALDLDEQQRRFALRCAFRVLDMEGCQLRLRGSAGETRAEVRLGPRRK